MLGRVLESKLLYIILSLLLAIVLWTYVVTVENKDIEVKFAGLPVTLVGEDDLFDARSMVVTSGENATVNLTFRGKRSVFARLDRERISITADVSGVSGAGRQALEYNVVLPSGASSLVVADRNRRTIDVVVSRYITATVELDGLFNGSVANGYLVEDFIFYPGLLQVSGPQENVERIDYARVTVTEENLTRSISENMPFELIDYDGNVMQDPALLADRATVLVRLPVITTREAPLIVTLTPGGGAGVEHVECDVIPAAILAAGEESALEEMGSVLLGVIELAKVNETGIYTFPIALPEGIRNESGIHDATVTVTIKGLVSKTLELTEIDVINVTDGYSATPLTQALPVTVRGPADAVARVRAEDIQIVANLADIGNAIGNYTVPAVITLKDYPEVGTVGDYKIVVSVVR